MESKFQFKVGTYNVKINLLGHVFIKDRLQTLLVMLNEIKRID